MREFKVTVFENENKEVVVDTFIVDAESAQEAIDWAVDVDDLNSEFVSAELV